jgi:anti-sigma regulatory factor (Ser/Thr protein kinase)
MTAARNCEWRTEIASTLEAIDEFCEHFRVWRKAACAEVNQFSTELLLREALTNSVLHGNGGDSRKRVRCVLRGGKGRLLMAIQDEGEGFDWCSARNRPIEVASPHGRGVEIYKQYANAVRFNRKGNSLVLIKKFE